MGLIQLLAGDPTTRAVMLAEALASRGARVLAAAKRALAAAHVRNDDGYRVEGRAFLSLVNHPDTISTIEAWLRRQAAADPPALDVSPLP